MVAGKLIPPDESGQLPDETINSINQMNAKTYNISDKPICPSCGKNMGDHETETVSDYVIHAVKGEPIKLGSRSASDHECGWCEFLFTATRISKTQVEFKSRY